MSRFLGIFVVISGLIEAVLGLWFAATAVLGRSHPVPEWLGVVAPDAPGARVLGIFLALACFLAAGIHYLIWRWLRDERDEAYALINLYGAFAAVTGAVLFGTLAAAGHPGRGIGFLLMDGLRGALLLGIAAVARHAPATVRELRLPAVKTRTEPRRAEARSGGRPEGTRHRGPGRREDRERERGRGPAEFPAPQRARAFGPPQPAPVVSRGPVAPPAAGDPHSERTPSGGRRSRGRRGGRRGRAAREGEIVARPLPPERTESPAPAPAPRREPEPHEPRFRADRGREDRGQPDRGREDRARPERVPADPVRAERRTGPTDEERPRRYERPFAAVRPPSTRMAESRGPGSGGEAADTVYDPLTIEVGRRPKRGRYSTGALFRPREKRVHRPLGGAAVREWAWPASEEPEPPAPDGASDSAPRSSPAE